jgi:hypothetical protein
MGFRYSFDVIAARRHMAASFPVVSQTVFHWLTFSNKFDTRTYPGERNFMGTGGFISACRTIAILYPQRA